MIARTLDPTRLLQLALLVGVVSSCGKDEPDGPKPEPHPFAGYVPDPDIFGTPTDFDDPDAVVAYGDLLLAKDLLFVVMADDHVAQDVDDLLAAVDGSIAGQIPDLGLYQVRVDGADLPSLQQWVDVASTQAGVEAVTFDHALDLVTDPDLCHASDDLDDLTGRDRCPWATIGAYQLGPIAEKLEGQLHYTPVRVAVIDTGIQQNVGEFSGKILNLDEGVLTQEQALLPPVDGHGHGTMVAGVIGANSGDGGVNGIASAVLGQNLQLISGNWSRSVFTTTTLMVRAVNAKAKVVNMSFGNNYDEENEWHIAGTVNNAYEKVYKSAPGTLFVSAAGNENLDIVVSNYSPAVKAANAIIVGGGESCDPLLRYSSSNHGALVETSAPATEVPVIKYLPSKGLNTTPTHDTLPVEGTSVAAPMVSSVAAILFSLDPTASGADIKTRLLDSRLPGPADVGHGTTNAAVAVLQHLVDLGPGETTLQLIDADDNPGWADPPGLVVNRICGGADVTVSGLGRCRYEQDSEISVAVLQDQLLTMGFYCEADDLTLAFTTTDPLFELGVNMRVPGRMALTLGFWDADGNPVLGVGDGGAVVIDECAITERGLNANPSIVEIGGRIQATATSMDVHWVATEHTIEGTFYVALGIFSVREEVFDHLEEACVGGIEQ